MFYFILFVLVGSIGAFATGAAIAKDRDGGSPTIGTRMGQGLTFFVIYLVVVAFIATVITSMMPSGRRRR